MKTSTILFLFFTVIFLGWISVVITGKTSFNPTIYFSHFDWVVLSVLEIPIFILILFALVYVFIKR